MHMTFFLLLPFVASMMYGLGYVLLEKVAGVHINPASFMVLNMVTGLVFVLPLVFVKGEGINFSGIMESWPVFAMVMVASIAPTIGWIASIYAIKNVSALYTALAETSYPLFTMAFGFLLFGIKHLNFMTFCGGALVLVGAMVMVYGQNLDDE